MDFRLTSSAFADGADIPVRFTCDGDNRSPRLTWQGAPHGTESFALIMDDPDAPRGTFTHWLLWDLPPEATELGEGASGGSQGRNSFGRSGYGGPCPPPGDPAHRYQFTLFALDVPTIALQNGTREQLEAKIGRHVLDTARLVGKYKRRSR